MRACEHLDCCRAGEVGFDQGNAAAPVRRLPAGGDPEDSGSVLGAVHRGWVSVKDALSVHSDRAVLEEAERGEDHALARYRKALKADLPEHVRALVQRQLAGAQANHDQVKMLRDSTRT
jgi:uncharacterized protein (TIGR02284 family)